MTVNNKTLAQTIHSDADERIAVRTLRTREIVVAVLPDEDQDDCLGEATDLVAGLYGDHADVSSVTCEGWEGGYDGPRERVLVSIGGLDLV